MLRKLAYIPLLAVILAPAAGYALGLGDIRVSSALNQPLDAKIVLTGVRPGEIESLEVRLASAESFERVGLDRPFVLTQLRFEVGENDAGQAVIKVTTTDGVREPFLSFLIEANWSRGRLLREYTILLDPPVLMPATAEPVRPAMTDARVSERERAPAPARPAPSDRIPSDRMIAGPGTYGPIQRGEVLWNIAESTKPSADITTSQMMLALFDANPEAFMGNINRMKAGYILRIPDTATITARTVADANYEVARQIEAWRGGESTDFRVTQAGPAAGGERLRLRAPGEARGSDPAGSGTGDAELQRQLAEARQEADDERVAREALAARLAELERETADLRRQLEIRDSELQALTGREPEPAAELPDTATEEPEVAAGTEEQPAADEAPARPAEPRPEPKSLVDQALELVTNPLVLAVIIGVPILGFLGFVALRRRRAASEASRAIEDHDEEDDAATQLGASEETVMRDDEGEGSSDKMQMYGTEEEPEPEAPAEEPEAEEAADDPGASGIMRLDESDPTSEADFHLAYGLYDQAADLMEGAVKQQPDNIPYVMKLLEIYFAWGKPDEFIKIAGQSKSNLESAGEWMNVAILGRQLKEDEPLFSDTGGTAARSDVDLDIAGGGDSGGEGTVTDMDADDFGFSDSGSGAVEEAFAAPEEEAAPEKKQESGDLEFDLSEFDAGTEEEPSEDAGDAGETQVMDSDDGPGEDASADEGLELDMSALDELPAEEPAADDAAGLDLDDALAGLESESESSEVEVGFSDESPDGSGDDDLSLDLDTLLDESGDDDSGSDGGSRLDLARAYIDMGDTDGAKALLQEVVDSGDEQQKGEAEELLKQLE